jgi:hypothetical protein
MSIVSDYRRERSEEELPRIVTANLYQRAGMSRELEKWREKEPAGTPAVLTADPGLRRRQAPYR